MAAVKRSGFALQFAAQGLRTDKEVVMAAVGRDGCALKYADSVLKADREVVMRAVCRDPTALLFADRAFQSDKEVVLQAVSRDGIALEMAAAALLEDKEVVSAAVSECVFALEHAGPTLLADGAFLRDLINSLSADELMYAQLFHITLLSGRSSHFVVPDGDYSEFLPQIEDFAYQNLLVQCSWWFGLDTGDVVDNGELMDARSLAPIHNDADLNRYARGRELHELQLVLRTVKRPRLED
mmetsp:Transcript_42819/g.100391  ORF Transcript_42819/g.100391 Transcript_42819/m.100391 type:complete len:240 (+) Transcript_42819:222-941(+)